MIQEIDVRFLTLGGAEIQLIRQSLYNRMSANNKYLISLGVDYFDQKISYAEYCYREQPYEQENRNIINLIDYLDSVQYPDSYSDREDVEYDED